MNKLIFGGILSLLISGNLPAAAQQPGQYVRKALPQPAFFVPQKDIQYQEKLPPFNLPPQPAEVKVQTTVEKVQYSEPAFQPEVISDNKEESVPDEFNPNLDITLPEVPQEKAEPQAATPKYQQEYAAYVKDLQAIEQSGQALPNQELEDDLAQMGSEQRLEVDAEGKILNPFSQAQLINPMAEAPVRDASVPKAAKKINGSDSGQGRNYPPAAAARRTIRSRQRTGQSLCRQSRTAGDTAGGRSSAVSRSGCPLRRFEPFCRR